MRLGPWLLLMLLAGACLASNDSVARRPDGSRAMPSAAATDEVSASLDQRIRDAVATNVGKLRQRGLADTTAATPTGMAWPLGPTPGVGTDWHGISNFVDLNLAFPNKVRDYTCAARSYDRGNGYNHRGTDIHPWPFPWLAMDGGRMDVLAAAPGTLIEKVDGHPDRSCSFDAPDTANYAIVLHFDGSIARYLHMKTGSVTTKAIGEPVAMGEYLGKVGSSGISTGPHLHFEVRANNNVNAAVVDPFNGACNTAPSGWANQRPYRDSRINRLSTHHSPPVHPTCPNTVDVPNFSDQFAPGDTVTLLAAYRDIGRGQVTSFRLLDPDQAVLTSWSFDMAEDAAAPDWYNGAYWYWQEPLPSNAKPGLWTFEASFQGRIHRHSFRVGADPQSQTPIPFPANLTGSWFDPATSGQGFNLELIDENRFILYYYGFDELGRQLWLFGDYWPGTASFAYGKTLVVPLVYVAGGRWTDFDPDAIERLPWGEARITFNSCRSAQVVIDGANGVQTLPLTKLVTPFGLACPP